MLHYETVNEILEAQAAAQPDALAFRFLDDGFNESAHYTYAQLQLQAQTIAGTLQSQFQMGDRLVLVYPDRGGLDFIAAFFGCLYAGIIAVPMNPTRNQKSLHDLITRCEDCATSGLLTNQALQHYISLRTEDDPALSEKLWQRPWIATDTLTVDSPPAWLPPKIHPNTVAFLQYTSGSTGRPKGVMISHRNLLHNSALIYKAMDHDASCRFVSWLPLFHDMGLIGGMLQPLYGGFPCTLIPPNIWHQKPLCWLHAISRYQATTSGGPDFAYDLVTRTATLADIRQLDLSTWSVAFSGSETVRASTLERFTQRFAPAGFTRKAFYPCYGMAEATLLVTGGDVAAAPDLLHVNPQALASHRVEIDPEHPKALPIVSCGRMQGDGDLKIVDTHTDATEPFQPCPTYHVGEVWIASESVSAGYWDKPTETAEAFPRISPKISTTTSVTTPSTTPSKTLSTPNEGDVTYLRSGDLGFLDDTGALFITGRIKDILCFRGRYHYPQDIEQTVIGPHEAVRVGGCAAFSLDIDDAERLLLALEVERRFIKNLAIDTWADAIQTAVTDNHGVSVHRMLFLKTGSLPRTTSGKIKRHACREGFLQGTLTLIGQWPPQSESQ